jgi:hypothetical protein
MVQNDSRRRSVSVLTGLLQSLVAPVANIFAKREERKLSKETAKGKLQQAKQAGKLTVALTDAEWESISTGLQDSTWKDEYVTVSVVSIFNLYIIGGIATAFGYPQVLEGTSTGIKALVEAGVDIGLLLTAVVFAAIGLKIWRA